MAGGSCMSDLTEDEVTVLMITQEGGKIAAIARWEKPCNSLVAKGLLFRHDKFNHSLTAAGKKALATQEKATDQALVAANNAVAVGRQQAMMSAEQAAQHLVLA